MIEYIKTKILLWALKDMVQRVDTTDSLIEIHLKNGIVICTEIDKAKSMVESLIANTRRNNEKF